MTTSHVTCPKCSAAIPPDDLNVTEGAAFCRSCGTLSRLRDILDVTLVANSDSDRLPIGCTVIDDGVQITVRASVRSIGGAVAMLMFAGFWNSIVSLFLFIVIADTLRLISGSVPSWFPTPNQGTSSGSGGGMTGGTVGGVIFMWVFLTPFVLIGVGLIGAFLLKLTGRTQVCLRDTKGVALTGVGPFAWKRRFDASMVKSVRIGQSSWQQNGQHRPVIVIEADRTIRIGSQLPDERRNWMAATLRKLLVH